MKKQAEEKKRVFVNIYSSSFKYSMIAIIVVACLEVFMISYTIMNPEFYMQYLWRYRTFYIVLLTAALLYIIISLYAKRDMEHRYKCFNVINPIYTVLFYGWALVIIYNDYSVTGALDITVFMTFSLMIPLGFYVLPQVYGIIAGVADALLIYMIMVSAGGVGRLINTSIFIIFQLVLGISFLLLKRRLAERIIQEQENADIDVMTGCGNRRAYVKEMEAVENGKEQEDQTYLAIDINGLKEVNDGYGHDTGDKIIIGTAECIEKCFGEKGKVFRIGGDEFIVITTESDLEKVIADYDSSLQAWSRKNGVELSTSHGYAKRADYPESDMYELAKKADEKMLQAKVRYYQQNGKERRKRSFEKEE